jgi:tRNA pseudouridine38-40 synthase
VPTYRLEIAYDGAGYHGFARQPGLRTVQGELESALGRILGTPVETTGAGRTDAGVHARHQVVSFSVPVDLDPRRLVRSLGGMLAPETAVAGCAEVEEGFSARFSATWREYRYRVLTASAPDPLRRHTTWHVPGPLDLAAMTAAADRLVGEHDFACFCRASEGRATVREVLSAGWEAADDLAVFTVRATSFCHQMVRSMTGWCVEVGRGRRSAEETPAVLAGRDRAAAGPVAPPHGLVLWEVGYA